MTRLACAASFLVLLIGCGSDAERVEPAPETPSTEEVAEPETTPPREAEPEMPRAREPNRPDGDTLVDAEGVIRFAHADRDYRSRPTPEQLLEAVDRARATEAP